METINLEDIMSKTSDLSVEKKVGHVAIIGRPNAGKSTFVNALLDEKVSITTNIPQTTRKKILAIHNDSDSQIIFFDTPGIHFENKLFNKEINNQATSSLRESDLILYFIDSSRKGGEEEEYIKMILTNVNAPIFKVYTKIDLTPAITVPADSDTSFSISSPDKLGFTDLISGIKKELPTGPLMYGEDFYTQQDMFFRVSEIIREKAFMHTKEEIPHSIYVSVEEIEETTTGQAHRSAPTQNSDVGVNLCVHPKKELLKIVAYINAESDSQKYILIGSKGGLIAKIGKEARLELEKIFEKKVFLALRVKVQKNWRKNGQIVKGVLG